MLKFLVGILLFVGFPKLFADEPSTMTKDERIEAFLGLDWKDPSTYKLPNSHSTLALPSGHVALIGKDANRAEMLMGEPSNDDIEAITYKDGLEESVIFESYLDGYVTIDDWDEIDASALLANISENTEKANTERAKFGSGQLHVVGWLQEPTLDRNTNTVYWAIEGVSDEGAIANSVALRLGRKGYEKLTWVTEKALYVPFGGELDVMIRAHSFDPGYRYNDYTTGDKLAGYGIATLVAGTVGGKIIKASGFVLLFKKLGGFIIAGIAAVFYKFKNLFRRNQNAL